MVSRTGGSIWAWATAIVCLAATNGARAANGATISMQAIRGAAVTQPQAIAAGPDGSVWFTNGRSASIGRIAPSGVVSNFTSAEIVAPRALTVATDGVLWFSDGVQVERLAPDGQLTSVPVNAIVPIGGLTATPDGSVWLTTGGEAIEEVAPDRSLHAFNLPEKMRGTQGIAVGPDGAIWFTNYLGASIGRISPDGTVTTYTDPRIRYPSAITEGPDDALWFADDSGAVGRISTTGAIVVYGTPATVGHPDAITRGPDGALWVTGRTGYVARVTTAGKITRYESPSSGFATSIASALGSLWVTSYSGSSIVRLVLPSSRKAQAADSSGTTLALAKPAATTTTTPRVTLISDSVAGAIWFDPTARAMLAQGVDLFLEPGQGRALGGAGPAGAQAPALDLIPALGRKLGQTVVMSIGDNDYYADDASNVAAAMNELLAAGVTRVIWTTLHVTPDHTSYILMNSAIRAAAAADPAHVTIADWNAYASGHPEWFQGDGVHLTGNGPHALAQLLHTTLVRLRIARS